jgi:hypothetical protein
VQVAAALQTQGHKIVGDLVPVPPGNYSDAILNMLKSSDIALFLLTRGTVGYDWVASEAGAAKAFRAVRGKPDIVSLVFPEGQVLRPIDAFTHKRCDDLSPQEAALRANSLISDDLSRQKPAAKVLFKTVSATISVLAGCFCTRNSPSQQGRLLQGCLYIAPGVSPAD